MGEIREVVNQDVKELNVNLQKLDTKVRSIMVEIGEILCRFYEDLLLPSSGKEGCIAPLDSLLQGQPTIPARFSSTP